MANTRGVFSLREVQYATEDGNWISQDESFVETLFPGAGYVGGGREPSGNIDKVDKIDYTTDTTVTVPGAALSASRRYLASVGNKTNSYFCGGYLGADSTSIVDKLSYATDTTARAPTANMQYARQLVTGAGNIDKGYLVGGFRPGGSTHTTTEKITYSDDTVTYLPFASILHPFSGMAGAGNLEYGYFSSNTFVARINYAAEFDTSIPSAYFTTSRSFASATGNSTIGYFGGGNPSPVAGASFATLDYATETSEDFPAVTLSIPRSLIAASGNSTSGYFSGGQPLVSTTDKINYITSTVETNSSASLTEKRDGAAGSSGRYNGLPQSVLKRISDSSVEYSHAGYLTGVTDQSRNFEKLDFPTDTVAMAPRVTLSQGRYYGGSSSSSTNAYFAGGYSTYKHSSAGFYTIVEKLNYATETSTVAHYASITYPRVYNTGSGSNSQDRGFFFGGQGPGNLTSAERLVYSTDTTTILSGAALSVARYQLAAAGNEDKAYIFSGRSPSQNSTTDKITYSSYTTAVSPSSFASTPTGQLQGVDAPSAAYFSGGDSPALRSTTDKITYSSDNSSLVPGANLANARRYHSATSSTGAGYNIGGSNPSPTRIIEKLNYSTETMALIPATTSQQYFQSFAVSALENTAPASNIPNHAVKTTPVTETSGQIAVANSGPPPNFGYIGGGIAPNFTSFDRINFNTDTSAQLPSVNYSSVGEGSSGTGNSTHGYYSSGDPAGTLDKLAYTYDTLEAVPSIPTRYYGDLLGNATDGYYSGGQIPSANGVSTLAKFSYSTDSISDVANHDHVRSQGTGVGNLTHGYFAGGYIYTTPVTTISTVHKVTYSSDSTELSPATLPSVLSRLGSSGISDRAYFVGGRIPGYVSTITKFTYSTETMSPAGSLVQRRSAITATGNSTHGYFSGGYMSPNTSMTEKFTYSTDTIAVAPAAPLSAAKRYMDATSALDNNLPSSVTVAAFQSVNV